MVVDPKQYVKDADPEEYDGCGCCFKCYERMLVPQNAEWVIVQKSIHIRMVIGPKEY
jgi:hypothetical protein